MGSQVLKIFRVFCGGLILASIFTSPAIDAGSAFIRFPKNFKWCVATAAHQVEGYNTESDWWDWENLPPSCDAHGCRCKVKNCEVSGAASDHWNRLGEDVGLLQELGVQQYRFSIEWAKVEPRQGEWDWSAVEHYKREVNMLQRAGIEPMITLQHFTLPRWMQSLGGWTWGGAPRAFERYAVFVFTQIAPNVRDWVTINEPLVHLGGGYALGLTPPGADVSLGQAGFNHYRARGLRQPASIQPSPANQQDYLNGSTPTKESLARIVAPMIGLLRAHARAYYSLHRSALALNREIRIGFAHHLRVFDPKNGLNPMDWVATAIVENLWNWSFPETIETGVLKLSIPFMMNLEIPIEKLAGTQDFFGVNYYTRDIVSFQWKNGVSVAVEAKEGSVRNDLDWEIYPGGFYRVLKSVHQRYPRLKILVTENGTADRSDSFRTAFLRDHLLALHRAIRERVPIESYCHWSLMDNFEWIEGFGPRFGLYEVDYATQRRISRPSAQFFSRLTRRNGFNY